MYLLSTDLYQCILDANCFLFVFPVYCLLLWLSAIACNAVHANCIMTISMANFVKQFWGHKREITAWK